MAVRSVFISSVIEGFEDVRAQTAVAVEGLGMHAVLAERHPANPAAARDAMFAAISDCDDYLLLMGERYGVAGGSGLSPTEEEYREALRLGKPTLVLVQEGVEMEPEQHAFLQRVRGTWGEGVFHGRFSGAGDVALAVTSALHAQALGGADDPSRAQERVRELAMASVGRESSGVSVRIAFAPLRQAVLLDALVLEDAELPGRLAMVAREVALIPQSIGIDTKVSAAGITLSGTSHEEWTKPEVHVAADGAIVAVGSVRGKGPFSGMVIDKDLLKRRLLAAARFANRAWDLIDSRGAAGHVAVCLAIPDAQHKVLGSVSGTSIQVPQALPSTVVVPESALIVPRGELTGQATPRRLMAEVRRVFADANALAE